MLPPTQNRPPVLESKAIITDKRTAEYGRLILDFIKNTYAQPEEKKTFRIFVEKFIHNYLQKKLSKDQLDYMQKIFKPGHTTVFGQITGDVFDIFQEESSCRMIRDKGWTEISNAYIEPNFWKEEIIGDETVRIRNKEYFTFAPTSIDPNKILLEVSKFYEALILAYSRLQDLAKINGWSISMKFKTNLIDLLDDLDSVVFYVSDEKAGDEVRKIVTEELEKLLLMIDRFGRPEMGFDIKFPDGKVLSHDQLVAKAVSKVIDDDYHGEKKIPGMSPIDFGKSIKKRVEHAGNLTPEQMLQVI